MIYYFCRYFISYSTFKKLMPHIKIPITSGFRPHVWQMAKLVNSPANTLNVTWEEVFWDAQPISLPRGLTQGINSRRCRWLGSGLNHHIILSTAILLSCLYGLCLVPQRLSIPYMMHDQLLMLYTFSHLWSKFWFYAIVLQFVNFTLSLLLLFHNAGSIVYITLLRAFWSCHRLMGICLMRYYFYRFYLVSQA